MHFTAYNVCIDNVDRKKKKEGTTTAVAREKGVSHLAVDGDSDAGARCRASEVPHPRRDEAGSQTKTHGHRATPRTQTEHHVSDGLVGAGGHEAAPPGELAEAVPPPALLPAARSVWSLHGGRPLKVAK